MVLAIVILTAWLTMISWAYLVQASTAVMDVAQMDLEKYKVPTAFDAEDWYPEDGYEHDPLDMESLDERWTQFYADRFNQMAAKVIEEG
jgi:hypothetical protein